MLMRQPPALVPRGGRGAASMRSGMVATMIEPDCDLASSELEARPAQEPCNGYRSATRGTIIERGAHSDDPFTCTTHGAKPHNYWVEVSLGRKSA